MMWDARMFVKVDSCVGNHSISHLFCNYGSGVEWAISRVYDPCELLERSL